MNASHPRHHVQTVDNVSSTQSHNSQHQLPPSKPKALRFVTNYGAPHPKRRRVGAACLTCRKRKTACSGERPTCDTCKQNKLECAGYSTESTYPPGQKHNVSDVHTQQTPAEYNEEREPRAKRHEHDGSIGLAHDRYSSDNHRWHEPTPPAQWTRSYSGASALSPQASQLEHKQSTSPFESKDDQNQPLFSRPRDRMPYFRWLGPTAIMPGFKQMVVKIKRSDNEHLARSSTNGDAGTLLSPNAHESSAHSNSGHISHTHFTVGTASVDSDSRSALTVPFYDNSPMPPSELITHLVHTFFAHLGCNYPFLQRDRFLRDLEEKQVDAILVDAVCALAARFSNHPLLTAQTHQSPSGPPGQGDRDKPERLTPAEYGHVFAQRAKVALVDTFACPSVAAVQAALLLAYLEFGESRDSGLWMYLGISIRMAQDLGLNTVEGLKYKGMTGLTPKIIKQESMSSSRKLPTHSNAHGSTRRSPMNYTQTGQSEHEVRMPEPEALHQDSKTRIQIEEQKAVEQERMDTFWAVFFLDRVVSSGTGRRSTLRDKDIELSFPALDDIDPKSGWPAPFPAVIRIVHLYGRVADLLNGIKGPSEITPDTSKRLAAMEAQVTHFYQGLSPRLHFDAVNFQHYMKAGEGTNFVLLHFWFHTLIILLHQPTLLKTFEGKMLQLFPNSQQLSMSSAKTIADILSYSHLMDAKASLGNPFTTQPIYIAACAFLKETVEQTASSAVQSRTGSPSMKTHTESRPSSRLGEYDTQTPAQPTESLASNAGDTVDASDSHSDSGDTPESKRSLASTTSPQQVSDQRKSALVKHTLLATAASQHYQLCYKALQSLETYWAGTKYILTILDQKFEGVEDPLLYTVEESESSMERPRPIPEFKSPGWRRKFGSESSLSGVYLPGTENVGFNVAQSPFWKAAKLRDGDMSKAIGWTLTGTGNSPSINLACHYPSNIVSGGSTGQQQQVYNFNNAAAPKNRSASVRGHDTRTQPLQYVQSLNACPPSGGPASGSDHLASSPGIALHSTPGSAISSMDAADVLMGLNGPYQTFRNPLPNTGPYQPTPAAVQREEVPFHPSAYPSPWLNYPAEIQPFGDMTIESQDVETSMLGLNMLPWFDNYPSHNVTGMLDTLPINSQGSNVAHRIDGGGDIRSMESRPDRNT